MRLLLVLILAGCPPTKRDTGAPCGEEACGLTQVCLQESFPPECQNRDDTGAACPDGTTATRCGGAGIPCCCGPAPALAEACLDAPACGATPTCDCLGDVCPDGKECHTTGDARVFLCEELPKP